MLAACCGPQHLRSPQVIPQEEFSEILSKVVKIWNSQNLDMEGEEVEVPEKDEFIEHLELQAKLDVVLNKDTDLKLDP